MTSRHLARLLAPLALVACAVALFAIVTSGGGEDGSEGTGAAPTATATATPKSKAKRATTAKKTYTVKPGDTPSSIAEAEGVALDDLLAANPDIDPNALTVGDKLKLP